MILGDHSAIGANEGNIRRLNIIPSDVMPIIFPGNLVNTITLVPTGRKKLWYWQCNAGRSWVSTEECIHLYHFIMQEMIWNVNTYSCSYYNSLSSGYVVTCIHVFKYMDKFGAYVWCIISTIASSWFLTQPLMQVCNMVQVSRWGYAHLRYCKSTNTFIVNPKWSSHSNIDP